MYLVRFARIDKRHGEEYSYHTKEEALNHFNLFKADNSCLYKAVLIYNDETNFVEDILMFNADGIPQEAISEGSVVRLKSGFCSDKERSYIYAVSNITEVTMRCDITCLNIDLSIPVTETVGLEMVYPIGTTVNDILSATKEKQ